MSLHVEYAEQGKEYGIISIVSLFCEYIHLEYERIHVIYRVNQAENVFHIIVVAAQEYVNIYSTRRVVSMYVHEKKRKGRGGCGSSCGVAMRRGEHARPLTHA